VTVKYLQMLTVLNYVNSSCVLYLEKTSGDGNNKPHVVIQFTVISILNNNGMLMSKNVVIVKTDGH